MTFALKLANIADAISAISISGVTVKDKDQLAASFAGLPNVLYPNPDGWLTDFEFDYKSVLRGSSAPVNVRYTLHYRFLGVLVGDMATMPVGYSALVDKVIAIVDAFEALHDPVNGVDLQVVETDLGPKTDPAGNQYFGADFSLAIEEIQN